MSRTRRWTVEIFVGEPDDRTTHAWARLDTDDDDHRHAHGTALRGPGEAATPAIGDRLAVAQTLSQLADGLERAAERELAQVLERELAQAVERDPAQAVELHLEPLVGRPT